MCNTPQGMQSKVSKQTDKMSEASVLGAKLFIPLKIIQTGAFLYDLHYIHSNVFSQSHYISSIVFISWSATY